MAATALRPCYCGCGRTFDRCHGLPRRARRERKRELDALLETHDVSALFPSVRPRDSVFEAYAEQIAASLDPADPRVPMEAIEDGLALLDQRERRRLVDEWVLLYPDRWASVCDAAGDATVVERAFGASAVRGAISERRPFSRRAISVFEDGSLSRSPLAALGLELAPPLVWNRDDAILIRRERCWPKQLSPRELDGAIELARPYVRSEHVERVRRYCERLSRQLPVDGLPVASDTLSRGCKIVASDDEAAADLAALTLVTYAQVPFNVFVVPRLRT